MKRNTMITINDNENHILDTSLVHLKCVPTPWHLPNDPFCLSFPVLYVVFPVTAVSEGTRVTGPGEERDSSEKCSKKIH